MRHATQRTDRLSSRVLTQAYLAGAGAAGLTGVDAAGAGVDWGLAAGAVTGAGAAGAAAAAAGAAGAAVAAELNLKSAIDLFRYHCKADKLQLIGFLFFVTCSSANQNLLHAATLITLLNESLNSTHAFF